VPTGKFITLEGIEGAGKSTCLAQVQSLLEGRGHTCVVTREPGGTALGESLRSLLLSHQHQGMSGDAELLLMFAARAEHLNALINPALAAGKWVLSDRFSDATFAYQGGGRGISDQRISEMAKWVQQGQRPDLTLLLDLPVATGLERAGKRSLPDRFEREQADFCQRVRDKYLQMAALEPDRIKRIDADLTVEVVKAQVAAVLGKYLDQHDCG